MSLPPFLDHPASSVAAEIAAKDWTGTPLGPIEGWPVSLRTTLATMLACPTAMYLAWGPELLSFYNDAYVPILGYRADTALGQPFSTLWANIWADIEPLVDQALAGGHTMVTDMLLDLARSGEPEESYWSFSYSPAYDDSGRIAGMFCCTSETTARVLAERGRDEADERLQLALSAGDSIGSWDWDVVKDCVRADARFATLYGVDPVAAAQGVPVAAFVAAVHPDDRDRVGREIGATLQGKDGFRSEYRLLRADGSVRWVSAQGMGIFDDAGACIRFPGVSFDITERIAAEQRLRESEANARIDAERVQLALKAGAIIGTWVWDLPSDHFSVDEPFARSFGIDPGLGHTGLSLAEVIATVHPADRAGLAAAIEEAIRRGGPYAHQYRVKRADGQYFWLEANGWVDHAPDGTALRFPGVLIDVDNRRSLEAERDRALADLRTLNEELEQRVADRTAELMRAEEALRQAHKMEAVGQLTGGIAHDFNNLLAGISGSLELISRRLAQGRMADVDRHVLAAEGAAKRAAALTHRLLAFSRRQTLAPRPTDVNMLASSMNELIQRTVGPAIAVETVRAAGLWMTLVDGPQLENALLNLCINARDAMPDGGRITIETANRRLDVTAARLINMAEGDYLSLCVSDTGTGMTPDVIAKAFDPFFTTKPIGQGTGLGLSMIYGFAKQSGGQVRIHSQVGDGTTVCIYLPRHFGEAETPDPAAEPVTIPADGGGATVLVVDDEPTVRMLVTDVLEDLGYTVIEADDGAAGLTILQSEQRIDLLVSDVGLPGGMNGRQMADAARLVRPGLKVLFITGYAENAVLDSGHLGPDMQVLTKPFAVDVLAARVRAAIGTRGA
ncbi:MAG: PAS domain-containing protein [Pseudomonadota bacterium]